MIENWRRSYDHLHWKVTNQFYAALSTKQYSQWSLPALCKGFFVFIHQNLNIWKFSSDFRDAHNQLVGESLY